MPLLSSFLPLVFRFFWKDVESSILDIHILIVFRFFVIELR